MEQGIVRVPIKIREPIQLDYCDCRGIGTVAVEGDTCWYKLDNINVEQYHQFMEEVDVMLPCYIRYSEYNEPLIYACLASGIPVIVETDRILPEKLVDTLIRVPHCAVHLKMNALENLDRKILGENPSPIRSLVKMCSHLKAWKVDTRLHIECVPHLVHLYDYCELFDVFKNCVSHSFIHIHDISDEYLKENKNKWSALSHFSMSNFKQIYNPEIATRSWSLKPSVHKKWVKTISEYARSKKVRCVFPDTPWSENRVRMVGESPQTTLGLRRYVYLREESGFVKQEAKDSFVFPSELNTSCGVCGGQFL